MKSPILLMIFKRADTTQRVFERIREAQPPKLYIAADGPRKGEKGEAEKCEETRKIVENIDWPCKVEKLYHENNLGCGIGPSTAISWFFTHEPEGIIIEDDILPHPDFFRFCDEMLEKYRHDKRIMMVSGHNEFYKGYTSENSYYLSHLGGIWGWASWRRAWNGYQFDLNTVSREELEIALKSQPFPMSFVAKWLGYYDMMSSSSRKDTWDYQWAIHRFLQQGLTILPYQNLTLNIGFDSVDATHTQGVNIDETLREEKGIYPLHQKETKEDWDADIASLNIQRTIPPLWKRIVNRMKRVF